MLTKSLKDKILESIKNNDSTQFYFYLKNNQFDINSCEFYRFTLLHYSILLSRFDITKILLEHKVDINIKNTLDTFYEEEDEIEKICEIFLNIKYLRHGTNDIISALVKKYIDFKDK